MSTLRLRGCVNDPDNFCYICNRFTRKKDRRNVTSLIKNAYYAYFGVKLGTKTRHGPHTKYVLVVCRHSYCG